MKQFNRWKEELPVIKEMIESRVPAEKIAAKYGVTKARMYQVMKKFDLGTPLHIRKAQHPNLTIKQYWLNRILCARGFSKDDRLYLIHNLELPDECPALGIPLAYEGASANDAGTRSDSSPSLDKIVPVLGYTTDNVQVLSWLANRIKTNATPQQVLRVGEFLMRGN